MSAAEIEEMLKSLDGVVVSDDELVQAPGLNEIANYLECALARAKDIDDPVLKWLIRSSLEHVRK